MLIEYENDQEQVTASLAISVISFSVLWIVLFLIFKNAIFAITGLNLQLLLIIVLEAVANAMSSFWLTYNRYYYSYKRPVIILVLISVVRMLLSLALILAFNSNRVLWKVVGNDIPICIIGLVLLVLIVKKSKLKFKVQYAKEAVNYNIFLVPHYLSQILLASADKVMIEKIVSVEKVGIYSLTYTFSSLMLIFFMSINAVYSPFMMKNIKRKNYSLIMSITNNIVYATTLISVMFICVAPDVFYIFAPKAYHEAINIIPILNAGIYLTFIYSIYSNIEFYYKEKYYTTLATIIGAVINIALNYFLIKNYGYKAAAFTTFWGYFVMAIMHIYFYNRIRKKNNLDKILDNREIMIVNLINIIISVVIFQFYAYIVIRYSIFIVATVTLIWLLIKNKNILKPTTK